MEYRILDLIATAMDACAGPPGRWRRGHPPAALVRVLAALRRFVREGTPWRGLRATAEQASGATPRRRLRAWARAGDLLQQAHAVPVALPRGGRPDDLIPDSCSVRAKRGGDLTGPHPTDRGKRGTKHHVAVTGDGAPVACAATAANVDDTPPSERLFLTAFAVPARLRTVFADKGYDAGPHRDLCAARSGPSPASTGAAGRTARGWAGGAGRSSAAGPGSWRTGAWRCAMTSSAW